MDIFGLSRELRRRREVSPYYLGKQMKLPANLCLPESEDVVAEWCQEHLNNNFGKLLETEFKKLPVGYQLEEAFDMSCILNL